MKKIALIAMFTLGSFVFAQARFGAWEYFANVDLITDEDTSFIDALASEYPEYARLSGLVVRCSSMMSNGVDVFFVADRYLGSNSEVTYRFDSGEPISETWLRSEDRESLFIPDRQVAAFLSALNASEQFIFRVSGPTRTYTYVVPVHGLNDAMFRLGCYTGSL